VVLGYPGRGLAQLQLQSHVIGCGGVIEASATPGDVVLSGTIGQVVNSSRFSSGSVLLFEGFWVPRQFEVVSVGSLGEPSERLHVFPNPFSVRVDIRIPRVLRGEIEVVMVTMAGERVRQIQSTATEGTETVVSIEAMDDRGAALPAGVYVIEVHGYVTDGLPVRLHQIVHLIH
jgi:hypothetical protein